MHIYLMHIYLTHWSLINVVVISKHMFMNTSCEIALRWMEQNTYEWWVNIGACNGLMPSGSKPLTESMFTHIYVIIWHHSAARLQWVNSSPLGQNGCLFADNNFRCIFVNEKFCFLVIILLKFVLKGPIDNDRTLVQIMAWHRIGDKTLSQ